MARGCDCKWIFVDHLSLIISGRDDGNERKAIDMLMTKLRSLCHETKIGMLLLVTCVDLIMIKVMKKVNKYLYHTYVGHMLLLSYLMQL